MAKIKAATVDEYIELASAQAQAHLRELRALLKELAPKATEAIKWGHPVLEEKRILFSFSAHQDHMNFMPTGPSLEPFREDIKKAGLKSGKDTVQLTYDKPLPKKLIRDIAAFRLESVSEHGARWMYNN